jgi:hypothetical protein
VNFRETKMRRTLVLAVLAVAMSASSGRAASLDLEDCYRKVQLLARSLFGPRRSDREVIVAPRELDRQMALAPPRDGSRMPVIQPRGEWDQNSR